MEKKLKHLKVYDKIYNLIQDGTYPPGSQLPSETVLSSQMGVSRMTLRKALTLLQDDGLTRNAQGVGHFVCTLEEKRVSKGQVSEAVSHPVYSYCTEDVLCKDFNFRIEPPTNAIIDSLGEYTPAVVIADRWYKTDDKYIAYTLSILPIDIIGEKKIDLNNPSQLLNYLENDCYLSSNNYKRIYTHSTAGNFTSEEHILSGKDSFLLVQENITDSAGRIIISNKHYIPIDKFRIEIEL